MARRVLLGLLIASVAAFVFACGADTGIQSPSSNATPAAPTSSAVTVDAFLGDWSSDVPPLGVEPSAEPSVLQCAKLEYKITRDPDSSKVQLTFAARCGDIAIRGKGVGVLNEGVLHWRAQGTVVIDGTQTCAFAFNEGTAKPLERGLLKVTYAGKVCDVAVRGTEIIRRR